MELINHSTNTTMPKIRKEHLTLSEYRKLKRLVLGYGNFTKQYKKFLLASEGASDHEYFISKMTLHNVVVSGYGSPRIIKAIRDILLNDDANVQN